MNDLAVVFDPDVAEPALQRWQAALGVTCTRHQLGPSTVLAATGVDTVPEHLPAHLAQPVAMVRGPLHLGDRGLRPEGTVVSIGPATVGDGPLAVFAGPCAVESREQLLSTAAAVADAGAVGLRGGAFKPRTWPSAFQGLAWAGVELLAEARAHTCLPVVTEVIEPAHVERMAATADALQIGARNVQNFALLAEVGRAGRPVVLKRGFGVTIEETLSAAEYILSAGNDQVVLCERGIRTFECATRFTLDLSAVPIWKQRTHLPVMVDPSHAAGIPALVKPLSLAAAAAGADALLIDVHIAPQRALCDGKQALLPEAFAELMSKLELLAMGVGRKLAIR